MTELGSIIAPLLGLTPAQIADETSLAPLGDSIGAMKLKLALKRAGIAWDAPAPATFGQLQTSLTNGSPSPTTVPQPQPKYETLPSTGGLGVDLQQISSLPDAADFWEHEFYAGTFSKTEIAYAISQPNPKSHFCAFWCSKEAARKSDRNLTAIPPNKIQVAHDPDGRPFLELNSDAGSSRLPHSLSISHSGDFAVAVVMSPASR